MNHCGTSCEAHDKNLQSDMMVLDDDGKNLPWYKFLHDDASPCDGMVLLRNGMIQHDDGDDILQLNSGEVHHKNGDKEGLLDDDDHGDGDDVCASCVSSYDVFSCVCVHVLLHGRFYL